MWDLINAPQTLIFGVAIMLMLMLGILERGGYELKPGSVISLGAMGAAHPAQPGRRLRADYRVGGRSMHVNLTLVP